MKSQLVQKLAVIISVIAIAFSLNACKKDNSNKVVIKGSTTVLPITQKAAEAFMKKNTNIMISISGGGSGNGIKALIDDSTDIANSSREIKGNEIDTAQKNGIQPKEIVVAYDMIVPIVHPDNPIQNLTLDQLKAIYDGSINNWKQLGGKDEKIIIVSRDTSSGTYEVWHEKIMKGSDVRKDALLQASNGAVANTVANNKKAIGYIGFGYINQSVKPLTVNTIIGTLENGKSGKFPISRKLIMYINEKKISEQAKLFIDFLLSADGQKLVNEAGFISID